MLLVDEVLDGILDVRLLLNHHELYVRFLIQHIGDDDIQLEGLRFRNYQIVRFVPTLLLSSSDVQQVVTHLRIDPHTLKPIPQVVVGWIYVVVQLA